MFWPAFAYKGFLKLRRVAGNNFLTASYTKNDD